MPIESPFNYWDPPDGEPIIIRPVRYEDGTGTFTPVNRPPKTIPVLRIWVDENPPSPAPLNYWDFSGARIRARLLPILQPLIARHGTLTLIRRGLGVATDYEVRT
jgi:hypothetical protein